MKVKLDHNLSRHLRISVEAFGHDVDTAFDEGLARATDQEVLRQASAENRILFTLDTDFLNLKKYPRSAMLAWWCFVRRGKAHWQ